MSIGKEDNSVLVNKHTDKVFDLFDTPIIFSRVPEGFENCPIEIHHSNRDAQNGVLLSFDISQRVFEFLSDDSSQTVEVKFSDINYILFSRDLEFQYGKHPVADRSSSSILPDEPQKFTILFKDGSSLSGESAETILDDVAIHLFRVNADNRAVRFFIPIESIENYAIGDKIGQILKKNQEITDKDLQRGLDKLDNLRRRPIGEYLEETGIINRETLEKALKKQSKTPQIKIGQLLLDEGQITQEQLDEALLYQKAHRSRRLGDILVEMGVTTENAVHTAVAHKLGIPFVRLRNFQIDPIVTNYIPAAIARQYTAMPLMISSNYLVVAVPDPTRVEDINVIAFASKRKIELAVSTPADIKWAVEEYYANEREFDEYLLDADISPVVDAVGPDEEMEKLANERPIVKLVHKLLFEGLKQGASDIHIRPLTKGMEVLFRIHGKLTHVKSYGKSMLAPIVARIKVIARMVVAQHNLPQDGKVQIKFEGSYRDVRISVVPTVKGESVVIRLLANAADLKPIHELGLSKEDVFTFNELLRRGSGLLIVTGPTGSGKTTTLYSALNFLREMSLNIITVEDPVEIQLEGLEQVQVRHVAGMDFSRVLRNVLRHDPDVIMIGEIRDEETAKIAVQAAQTDHLVLTTLHTNSAADTILRLKDMDIEPYMIASALLGIISQRLLKRNCNECRIIEEVSPVIMKAMNFDKNRKFYVGKGCDKCNNTGVSGRIPAYEFLRVSPEIREAIINNSSSSELNHLAKSLGMQSMTECGLTHAGSGKTSLSEVHRINLV